MTDAEITDFLLVVAGLAAVPIVLAIGWWLA